MHVHVHGREWVGEEGGGGCWVGAITEVRGWSKLAAGKTLPGYNIGE